MSKTIFVLNKHDSNNIIETLVFTNLQAAREHMYDEIDKQYNEKLFQKINSMDAILLIENNQLIKWKITECEIV